MSTDTPPGIFPLFLRGSTLEKYGMKTGEGVNDVLRFKYINKDELLKEIQIAGVMSDFSPAKKQIESCPDNEVLVFVDHLQRYGESFLICYTSEAKENLINELNEQEEALKQQLLEEQRIEEEKRAAEEAKKNIVYEDKPIEINPWITPTAAESEIEVRQLHHTPFRPIISFEVLRPKRLSKQKVYFTDRNADVGGVAEFRPYKDPNFRAIRERDNGIQVAPTVCDGFAQTAYFRPLNKAVQYESTSSSTSTHTSTETDKEEIPDSLLAFLEKAVVEIEKALQQNESVDIFNDAFHFSAEEGDEDTQAENELREVKNFADANYSKSRALVAIDWMPKAQGLIAVSAIRNISFDQRIFSLKQTSYSSYVMLWDFRQLVKPLVLMQSPFEVLTFRFNKVQNHIIAGGCLTGQVVLWDISDALKLSLKKNYRSDLKKQQTFNLNPEDDDDDEQSLQPVQPLLISSIDNSHKKPINDLYWLPPHTQINHRGLIVADEYLDGNSYQFVTVASDGFVMVWDIRYEQIFRDELKFIGRSKNIPTEKLSNKEGGKPLWAPIFKTHLKRLENTGQKSHFSNPNGSGGSGMGELSLSRVCENTSASKNSSLAVGKPSPITTHGDSRSQLFVTTEEGDILLVDLSSRQNNTVSKDDDNDDEETENTCVKWMATDHPRPSVKLQESPFFPHIVLSISDWQFHIWKIGEDRPIFSSPLSSSYLTSGAWSPTRPAVLFVACADGQVLLWDFTDSGFRPSIELKATHAKITSMEILTSNQNSSVKHQLMAVGDEVGTLHIFELPRNATKPVPKEELIMHKFLERELQLIQISKSNVDTLPINAPVDEDGNLIIPQDNIQSPVIQSDLPIPPSTGTTQNIMPPLLDSQWDKDEEEFLKLEAAFITELGLDTSNIPMFNKIQ